MLHAHARVYHAVTNHTKTKISIALNSDFIQPRDPQNQEDAAAAERGLLWRMGWFADPLFFNDYPQEMRDRCGSRLPVFSETIQGTLDFFSLNHYTTLEAWPQYNQEYSLFQDAQADYRFPPGSSGTASSWLHIYPPGIYRMMQWIYERYPLINGMEFIITESGVSTYPGQIDDQNRINYLFGYIPNAIRAAEDLGIHLSVYCVWSLLDNFEWAVGYQERYGLFDVDFATLQRTPKKSAYWLRNTTLFTR
jgi:beta-glucosidase/6-phospho-beta-glucosidase/beta-galactosidase